MNHHDSSSPSHFMILNTIIVTILTLTIMTDATVVMTTVTAIF